MEETVAQGEGEGEEDEARRPLARLEDEIARTGRLSRETWLAVHPHLRALSPDELRHVSALLMQPRERRTPPDG